MKANVLQQAQNSDQREFVMWQSQLSYSQRLRQVENRKLSPHRDVRAEPGEGWGDFLRDEVVTKQIFILTDSTQSRAKIIEAVMNAPAGNVIEIKPYSPKRSASQNRLQWADMLGEFSRQVVIEGRTFSVDAWHYQLKAQFLPDSEQDGITLPGYKKWEEMPDGSLRLVGSTTKLTKRGMSDYLTECYAYGSQELGIRFTVRNWGES